MQQLSEAFRRYQGGTQGSVPVPADAACAQMFPFLASNSARPAGRSPRPTARLLDAPKKAEARSPWSKLQEKNRRKSYAGTPEEDRPGYLTTIDTSYLQEKGMPGIESSTKKCTKRLVPKKRERSLIIPRNEKATGPLSLLPRCKRAGALRPQSLAQNIFAIKKT